MQARGLFMFVENFLEIYSESLSNFYDFKNFAK